MTTSTSPLPEPMPSDQAGSPSSPGSVGPGPALIPEAGATPEPPGSRPAYTWGQTFGRMWQIMRPIRFRLVAGFLCAAAGSVFALMIPQVLQRLINGALADAAATTPAATPPNAATAAAAATSPATAVLQAVGLVVVLGVLEAVLVYMRRVFAVTPATEVERTMRLTLFRRLLRLPTAFHDEWGSGQLLSRSMSDLGQVRRWLAFALIMLMSDLVTITIGVTLMVRQSARLALVFVAAAVPVIVMSYFFARRYHELARASQDRSGDLATTVEESVEGIRVLKAFGQGDHALRGFSRQADKLRDVEVAKATTGGVFDLVLIVLPEAALGVALFLGLHQVAGGAMTVGALAAWFTTAAMVSMPVRMIGQLFAMTVNTKTALDRQWEVLDSPLTVADPPRPVPAPWLSSASVPIDEGGSRGSVGGSGDVPADEGAPGAPVAVEFQGVRFRYPDAPAHMPDVLRGVDLRVEPGETLAIVGVVGSGKTTLLDLVPRLYDATAGRVTIDGVDVRDLRLADLRRTCAMTFEDAILFGFSVRDNVLLGAPPALQRPGPAGDALLARALHTADADEFVVPLAEGVDTAIGEEGLSLSGGQRQRLALARAIAARPQVLLLDDPLSALDTRTEERVSARLREALHGTTTLIVAHRPSTVDLADRVALVDEGRIAGVGTHREMMAASARYRAVIADLEHAEPPEHAEPGEEPSR